MRHEETDSATHIVPAPFATVLTAIANAVVGDAADTTRIGSVTLHPHQREGADRVYAIMQRHGGALLCDAVGVGKTYIALAIASRFDHCIVVAPAVLRDMWTRAIAETGVDAILVSVESLGRRSAALPFTPLVIVDEAHHLRNPATRRYDAAARMCASARTLLLTATPLHNTRRDLAALVALFAGVRAHAWTDDELSTVIVRREREAVGALTMPRIEHGTVPPLTGADEHVLDELLALPPPVPPSDGAEAGSLVVTALVRQWTSSTAALRGALRRRIARGSALLAAFTDGRHPTRAELRDWVCTEDSVQLAFTELLASTTMTDPALRAALEHHIDALSRILCRVETDDRADVERASVVRDICIRHAPRRVVAFTGYQDTAESLYRALRGQLRAALLTGRGGLVAGGAVSRAETLARFAPESSGAPPVAEPERIDLLVTTDLLSEGVNLQDAAVVVHLDLPWTSARLAQRVGRLARVGSRHEVVTAYTLRPPPRAESILRATHIIRHKAALAGDVLGARAESALPATWLADVPDGSTAEHHASVECAEHIRRRLALHVGAASDDAGALLVARCTASMDAALAACAIDGVTRLVVMRDGRVESASAAVLAVLDAALASAAVVTRTDPHDAHRVLDVIEQWYDSLAAARDAGVDLPVDEPRVRTAMRTRRRAIGRLDGAASTSAFTRRESAVARAAGLRTAAAHPLPVGLERMLYAASDPMIAHPTPPPPRRADIQPGVRVIALLLLTRPG